MRTVHYRNHPDLTYHVNDNPIVHNPGQPCRINQPIVYDPKYDLTPSGRMRYLGACLGISIQVTSMDDQSVQIASIRPQCSFAPIPAA